MKIKKILGIEVLDSRGCPTVCAKVFLENGVVGSAMVPSGASRGEGEALELRDGDKKRYNGKGVLKALENIEKPLAKALVGMDVRAQKEIDHAMIALDGTPNKSKFGANAILGISLAVARASAIAQQKELYEVLGGGRTLPLPMMNVINGGAHADNTIDIQEFMIRPIGASCYQDAIRMGAEIFHVLKGLLSRDGYATSVGDEGGFAPNLKSNEAAIEFLLKAIEKAHYRPGQDVTIALDCAANFFFENGGYLISKKAGSRAMRSVEEQIEYYKNLVAKYPIDSIEDPLEETDFKSLSLLTKAIGDKVQIVGDDIFVTNPKLLKKGIEAGAANAILIKLNQIGTLTETLETIALAKANHYNTVISHRSGETEDTFIADLAVATDAHQIKTGSLSRSERTAKYNRLIEIASH